MPRIITYRFTRLSIDVPVCDKHRSILNVCRGGFWLSAVVTVFLTANNYHALAIVFASLAVMAFLVSFKLTRRFFIFEHDDNSITYASHDEKYLITLCNLNKATAFLRSYLA